MLRANRQLRSATQMALITSLQERIKELEAQKLAAEGQDSKLHSMMDELKAENQYLRSNLSKIMRKLQWLDRLKQVLEDEPN